SPRRPDSPAAASARGAPGRMAPRRSAAQADRRRNCGTLRRPRSFTTIYIVSARSHTKGNHAMGKLVIKNRGKLVGEINIKLGDMKIGRKAGCDVVLDDPAVSGEHALIKTVGLKSSIEDLDSTNGTFIDNKRVHRHELRHGDEIIIGAHTLVYRDDVVLDTPVLGKRPAPPPAPSREQEKTKILTAFAQL